jgi:transposase InsO family protein
MALNKNDDFNREPVVIEIDTSLRSERMVRVFERLKVERGLADMLRVDNSPEFLGQVFVDWCQANGVLIDYIEPGKPNQNALIERFNRSVCSAANCGPSVGLPGTRHAPSGCRQGITKPGQGWQQRLCYSSSNSENMGK